MTRQWKASLERLAKSSIVGGDAQQALAALDQLERDLAAAQEARQAAEARATEAESMVAAIEDYNCESDGCLLGSDEAFKVAQRYRKTFHEMKKRAQRAEALAERNLNALNRFKEEREGNTRQFQRLQHRLAQAEADASSLAAGQCIVTNGGLIGDDYGHLYCDMQRQRDELRGQVRVMADIMDTALDVIKTVEGDGSDEDEALMHIRAKMASAIDSGWCLSLPCAKW